MKILTLSKVEALCRNVRSYCEGALKKKVMDGMVGAQWEGVNHHIPDVNYPLTGYAGGEVYELNCDGAAGCGLSLSRAEALSALRTFLVESSEDKFHKGFRALLPSRPYYGATALESSTTLAVSSVKCRYNDSDCSFHFTLPVGKSTSFNVGDTVALGIRAESNPDEDMRCVVLGKDENTISMAWINSNVCDNVSLPAIASGTPVVRDVEASSGVKYLHNVGDYLCWGPSAEVEMLCLGYGCDASHGGRVLISGPIRLQDMPHLKTVQGVITMLPGCKLTIEGCEALEYIKIEGLRHGLDLSAMENLDAECVVYAAEHASNSVKAEGATIMVSSSVYAAISAERDLAALKTSTGVEFVEVASKDKD